MFVLSIFTMFILWISLFLIVSNPLLLPSPFAVFKSFIGLFSNLNSVEAMVYTVFRLLFSLLIAFICGFGLGILAGFHKRVAYFLSPIVSVLRTIPVISIVVILLIVVGFKTTPYIISFLMIFPLIYQAIYGGIRSIDSELIDVYKLEDNSVIGGLLFCYIPLIRNHIRTALYQALGLGIKVLVMAEFLAQTKKSIGNSLYLAKVNLAYDEVFAWTIFLIILVLIMELFIHKYQFPLEKSNYENSVKKSSID